MTGPRDWDKEMAEIDKMIAADKVPPASSPPPAAAQLPARTGAPPTAQAAPRGAAPVAPTRPRDALGVWFRAILGALGLGGLMMWPYGTACGTPLYGFLAGAAAVAAAGIWTMRSSWTHRRGLAHIIGTVVLLGGLAVAASEILPRIGYSAVAKTWTCN